MTSKLHNCALSFMAFRSAIFFIVLVIICIFEVSDALEIVYTVVALAYTAFSKIATVKAFCGLKNSSSRDIAWILFDNGICAFFYFAQIIICILEYYLIKDSQQHIEVSLLIFTVLIVIHSLIFIIFQESYNAVKPRKEGKEQNIMDLVCNDEYGPSIPVEKSEKRNKFALKKIIKRPDNVNENIYIEALRESINKRATRRLGQGKIEIENEYEETTYPRNEEEVDYVEVNEYDSIPEKRETLYDNKYEVAGTANIYEATDDENIYEESKDIYSNAKDDEEIYEEMAVRNETYDILIHS